MLVNRSLAFIPSNPDTTVTSTNVVTAVYNSINLNEAFNSTTYVLLVQVPNLLKI